MYFVGNVTIGIEDCCYELCDNDDDLHDRRWCWSYIIIINDIIIVVIIIVIINMIIIIIIVIIIIIILS